MKFNLGDRVSFVSEVSGKICTGKIIGIGDDDYTLGDINLHQDSNEMPFFQAKVPEHLLKKYGVER